jgi:hypothetical protein
MPGRLVAVGVVGVARTALAVASLAWPSAIVVARAPDRLFAIVGSVDGSAPRLVVRDESGPVRVLFDPSTLGGPALAPAALGHVLPSADGRHVALTFGTGASARTRVVDATTGMLLPDDLPRTPGGATAWSLDGTTLFACRLPPAARDEPSAGGCTVVAHRLGGTDADTPIFGHGVDPNVPIGPTDLPSLVIPAGSNDAIGVVARPGERGLSLDVAPIAAVLSGGQAPWREAVAASEMVTAFDVDGETAYLLSAQDAPNGKILTLDLSDPSAAPTPFVAASGERIDALGVAADGLYVLASRAGAGASVLRRYTLAAGGVPGSSREITLPTDTRVRAIQTDARFPGALIMVMHASQPPRSELVDGDGTIRSLDLADPAPTERATPERAARGREKGPAFAPAPVSSTNRRRCGRRCRIRISGGGSPTASGRPSS